jgi:prolyl oligopeptidase
MPLSNAAQLPIEELIHGTAVMDPCRWLEDRQLPETEEWIRHQQGRCDKYFAQCCNLDVLRDRVRKYLDTDAVDEVASVEGQYFYRRRAQGQEQASIYVRDRETGMERLLVDPSGLGPFASVGIQSISQDGSLLAYDLKYGGGDRKAIHFVDVVSGRTLSDSIPLGYARGFSFASDCLGFYYCQEGPQIANDHTVRFHRFGATGDDRICFQVPRTPGSRLILTTDEVHLGATVTHQRDGNFLVDLWIACHSKPDVWCCVFTNRTLPFVPMLNRGRVFAISYKEAPDGKLVEFNLAGSEIRAVVPEQAARIRQVVVAGDKVFLNYLDQLAHSIHCWDIAGNDLGKLSLPSDGTVQIMHHYGGAEDNLFLSFETFGEPPAILEYGIVTNELRFWHRRSVAVTRSLCTAWQESYPSKDGMNIPVTLVAQGGIDRTEPAPAIMTSYGGFGVSITPRFSVLASVMMELGCTFVLPHIRGGGEFGKDWHDAARGRNRQVAFDDFIAASEWLCEKSITTPTQLAIIGGSNSGLLVATVMIQRPELFRAVLCIAPLLDMVRYESFDRAAQWRNEYGSVTDPQEFAALHSYSPYHHVEDDMNYPAVLFVSGDQDDRCNPAHVRKMAARLQDRSSQCSPILVDYSKERGHTAVMPLSVRVEALTRRIAFLCNELDIPIAFGGGHEEPRV